MENNKAHQYRAFGLGIESHLPLPELKSSNGCVQITIRLGNIAYPGDRVDSDRCLKVSHDEVFLHWERAGSFLMKGGVQIIVQPAAEGSAAELRLGILGPGLATILQQRGSLALHASAVVIGGKAAAFIGWKGQGKSTTAATLFARGHRLLTDDILSLSENNQKQFIAQPGFPQFKLWPDSAKSALEEDPEQLPKLFADFEKRAKVVIDNFTLDPAPLAAIYVLGIGPELAARRLSSQETFKEIVNHTFCARYGGQMFQGEAGAKHFRNVAGITASVPVFKFERPSSLERLDLLANFIVKHIESL
jgi:hypothetical protein